MKLLFFIVILILFTSSITSSRIFYFEANGSDYNSNEQAQSPITPWKSINKFNSFQQEALPGDIFLFNRGDTFYGSMQITSSGNSTSLITLGNFGNLSNPLPIITGAITASGWVLNSSNSLIWKISLSSTPSALFLDGERLFVARSPNRGSFYEMVNIDDNGYGFTDPNRTEPDNYFDNCLLRGRMNNWASWSSNIMSYSAGGHFVFQGPMFYPTAGYGYFLEGRIDMMDVTNEWFYDSSTSILYIIFAKGDSPNNHVIETVIDSGILFNSVEYWNVTGLQVEKSSGPIIQITGSNQTSINFYNNIIQYGQFGILYQAGLNCTIYGNQVSYTDDSAINIQNSAYTTIQNNIVKNTALEIGYLTQYGAISSSGGALYCQFIGNFINITGYLGIGHYGQYNLVDSNHIDYSMSNFSDGGGIYAWGFYSYGNNHN